jgi:dTMP kinase
MTRIDSGILIAVEGIDGTGKTTQVAKIVDFFWRNGEQVIPSKEPTDGPWGRKLRESATTGRLKPEEELHAFVEDRKQHVKEVILPALTAGKMVVLDRYLYSTIAYQGVRGGGLEKLTEQMLAIAPEPDAVLLIDLPPEAAISRISQGRGEKPNAFEELANLAAVRQSFLGLAKTLKNITIIEGRSGTEAVHHAILKALVDGALKAKMCFKPQGCDGVDCDEAKAGACRWSRLQSAAFSG